MLKPHLFTFFIAEISH